MSAREAEAAHEAAIDATAEAVTNAKKAIEDKLVADGMGADAAKARLTSSTTSVRRSTSRRRTLTGPPTRAGS
jgi:hypothetical protein